jgi:hypothetical protein
MIVSEIMKLFIKESPVTVMARSVMEFALPDTALNQLFHRHAERQYEDELLFSTVVKVMALVVSRERNSVNEAYRHLQEEVGVSVQALYDKLRKTEPVVSQALVRESFLRLKPLVSRLQAQRKSLFPGYCLKILDGNHLTGTEHRIRETRTLHSSPLPGQALVVLHPDQRLIADVFPCEDAHAQERRMLDDVLPTVKEFDLWLADRNFCTTAFLFGLHRKKAAFIIRQHSSTLTGKELLGKPRRIGRSDRGVIFEQTLKIVDPQTQEEWLLRRITIKLNRPTEDGETEIHLVTNLPRRFGACRIAAAYLDRWTIERAFQELEQSLRGEVNTLGYPCAALLGFSVALLLYNILSVVRCAMQSKHGADAAFEQLSCYYLSSEIAAIHGGMMIAIPRAEWSAMFRDCNAVQMAAFLRESAGHAKPAQFRKNVRGPKKPPPKRTGGLREKHVSTHRLLANRGEKSVTTMTA